MLSFSHSGLNARKLKADNIFSAAIETELDFEVGMEMNINLYLQKSKRYLRKKKNRMMNAFQTNPVPLSF